MDLITRVGGWATAVAAIGGVLAYGVKGTRAAARWRRERRLEGQCRAILARNPNGLGVVFHIEPEELEAAQWGERRGLLGIARSLDGWSIFRK